MSKHHPVDKKSNDASHDLEAAAYKAKAATVKPHPHIKEHTPKHAGHVAAKDEEGHSISHATPKDDHVGPGDKPGPTPVEKAEGVLDPKVYHLSRLLKIHVAETIGLVYLLGTWKDFKDGVTAEEVDTFAVAHGFNDNLRKVLFNTLVRSEWLIGTKAPYKLAAMDKLLA